MQAEERTRRGSEPSLRDAIAESGETPIDSQRAALSLDWKIGGISVGNF